MGGPPGCCGSAPGPFAPRGPGPDSIALIIAITSRPRLARRPPEGVDAGSRVIKGDPEELQERAGGQRVQSMRTGSVPWAAMAHGWRDTQTGWLWIGMPTMNEPGYLQTKKVFPCCPLLEWSVRAGRLES
jgi:hypothetical protein